jgi:hypothetical protein
MADTEKEFALEVNLAHTPLPEILHSIEIKNAEGVLSARHKDLEKKLYIQGGRIIFASSNNPDDRLGEFLLRKKKITKEDYNNSVKLLKTTKKRQGAIFVDLGCLTPKQLFWAVKEQIREIVWSLFNWIEGDVIFQPGTDKQDEVIKLSVSLKDAVMEGIKHIANARRIVSYIGSKDTLLEIKPNFEEKIEEIGLDENYLNIANLLDKPKSLFEVCQESMLGNIDTCKIIYILLIYSLIKRIKS